MRKKWWYFLPGSIVAIIIFLLSTVFGAKVPNPMPELISPDKLGHLLAYFVLSVSFLWAFAQTKQLNRRLAFWVVITCASYGIVLEFVQFAFFPERYFEWWDMLANLVGALLAILIIRFINKSSQNG